MVTTPIHISMRLMFYSHGLQLLIKDILNLPWFHDLWVQATAVVTAFRKSPLQLALLRDKMQDLYGRHQALTLAIITRWGSQFSMIKSLLKNKQALMTYGMDKHANIVLSVLNSIVSRDFWGGLEETERILAPIHDRQRLSEADSALIHSVMPAWLAIREHLSDLPQDRLQAPVETILNSVWEARFAKQVMDLHRVAWALHPEQYCQPITVALRDSLMRIFPIHFRDTKTMSQALTEFYAFRNQTGGFIKDSTCWNFIENPILFWQLQTLDAPTLGPLAERLMDTPANSVPSERAFSIQNLVHTKARNLLSTLRVDKLQYIHINQHIIRRTCSAAKSIPIAYTEDELVALEDVIMMQDNSHEDVEDMEATGGETGKEIWLGQAEET